MDEQLMKIGEIAAFFNISVKALRIYEKKGIIKPAKIDTYTGYRYYTTDQVNQLNALIELKALGFSLSEIKNIIDGGMTDDKLMAALMRKRMAWQETIMSAENKISALDGIMERLSSDKPATKLHELSEDERAWLLVKMVCVEDLQAKHILSEALWL